MAGSALSQMVDRPWPKPVGCSVELTEQGLVFAGGSLLVRMRKSSDGRQEFAVGTDRERMLAMLSIAFGRPMSAQTVLPHVESAAYHWGRGEKALAHLRLVFAGLAKIDDPSAGTRVALAACLLDQGWPPAALLEELGLAKPSGGFEKYNHAHVPAGYGRRSGQFDFRSGTGPSSDRRIVVAGDESDKEFEFRELTGHVSPKEEIEHHHPISPMGPPIPFMGGAFFAPKPMDAVSAAAKAAAAKVGPGKGSVYGTAVHTELKAEVKGQNRPDLHCEQSYLNGVCVKYGTPGSIRVDVAHPSVDKPQTVFDLKTGGAKLTKGREEQIRTHLPKRDDGREIEIHEIRP